MLTYYILLGAIALVSFLVSARLKSKFAHYSQLHLRNGMSGAEIAEKMLHDHGIYDVQVLKESGMLTDHYNPAKKTVNLSEGVYNQRNAAAAAVAAHEVGHAVQHATAYQMLQLRSNLVPIANISSTLSQWLIFGGLILSAAMHTPYGFYIAILGLVLMAIATLFSFITLPVEYDASHRALAWLENKNMLTREEHDGAKDALKWAARTYVVAAIGALASLIYWAFQVFGSRR